MAKIAGDAGLVTYDSNTVDVTSWSVDQTAEVQNVTDSGSAAVNEYIPNGYTDWTASFEGWVQTADAGGEAIGSAATLILTAKASVTWTGSAIITGRTVLTNVNGTDAVKISYTAQGSGALTIVNA